MLNLKKMTDDAPKWGGGPTPPLHRQSEGVRDMRHAERIRIRAKTRARGTVVCGKLLKPGDFDEERADGQQYGTIEFMIYDDAEDIRDLSAKVESAENRSLLRGYEATVLRLRREHVANVLGGSHPLPMDRIPEDPRVWDTEMKRIDGSFSTTSVEAEFHRSVGRGIRPLYDLEVLESGIPHPTSKEEKHSAGLVGSIVAALGQTGGSSSTELAEMRELIASLTAKVEELETRPDKKPRKG